MAISYPGSSPHVFQGDNQVQRLPQDLQVRGWLVLRPNHYVGHYQTHVMGLEALKRLMYRIPGSDMAHWHTVALDQI